MRVTSPVLQLIINLLLLLLLLLLLFKKLTSSVSFPSVQSFFVLSEFLFTNSNFKKKFSF